MLKIVNITELVVALLLIVSILLQNRGAGLGGTFGGDFGGYYSKRGFEKFLVFFSIVLAAIFLILSIANLFLASQSY